VTTGAGGAGVDGAAGITAAVRSDGGTGSDAAARRTAAVVVNYESGGSLASCLADLRAAGLAEVAIVDNGSTDGSVARAVAADPDVEVIAPGRNLGYGAAANRGVAATTAPYVLVCNTDLEVPADVVAVLADVLDADPGCALVGPLIRTPDGDRYPSARQFPSMVDAAGHAVLGIFAPDNRFTRAYQRTELDDSGPDTRDVDWVSGACFLVRRTAFESVGGFDEAYFMYAEDVDLCWRLGRAGWGVCYAPRAEVTHVQGQSTARHPYRMILEHHRSLLRFSVRSTTGWRRVLLPLVAVGVAVRLGLALFARATRG
jgi:N-acetylglucosaminyl-diphospho-decaprenol L-rhamnosyltransferase